jgi:uncharacterized RDD family membrane protein YckC
MWILLFNCEIFIVKQLLQEWVNLQNAFRAMTYFPLMQQNASIPQTTPTSTSANQTPTPIIQGRIFDQARAEEIIRVNGGYEMLIAPLYKRFLAEVLDTIILFVIKIAIFVIVIDAFDLSLQLDLDIGDLKDMKFLEDGYIDLLNLSSEFILLEILTKIVSCLYEAFFSVKFGASIGKLVLGIRIVQADAVLPLEQQINHSQGIRALVFPAVPLSFFRALLRAIAKNLLVTLLFPVYFMLFFYRSNQLIYDMLLKTVVVEHNPNPVLRRRN